MSTDVLHYFTFPVRYMTSYGKISNNETLFQFAVVNETLFYFLLFTLLNNYFTFSEYKAM